MKILLTSFLLCWSVSSYASWTDTGGQVVSLVTYAHTNTILVTLSKDGTDVEACSNKKTFAISKDIGEEQRTRMYSMLLAAQAVGRDVVVSYNRVGNCEPWDANPSGYRKIVRLR